MPDSRFFAECPWYGPSMVNFSYLRLATWNEKRRKRKRKEEEKERRKEERKREKDSIFILLHPKRAVLGFKTPQQASKVLLTHSWILDTGYITIDTPIDRWGVIWGCWADPFCCRRTHAPRRRAATSLERRIFTVLTITYPTAAWLTWWKDTTKTRVLKRDHAFPLPRNVASSSSSLHCSLFSKAKATLQWTVYMYGPWPWRRWRSLFYFLLPSCLSFHFWFVILLAFCLSLLRFMPNSLGLPFWLYLNLRNAELYTCEFYLSSLVICFWIICIAAEIYSWNRRFLVCLVSSLVFCSLLFSFLVATCNNDMYLWNLFIVSYQLYRHMVVLWILSHC